MLRLLLHELVHVEWLLRLYLLLHEFDQLLLLHLLRRPQCRLLRKKHLQVLLLLLLELELELDQLLLLKLRLRRARVRGLLLLCLQLNLHLHLKLLLTNAPLL